MHRLYLPQWGYSVKWKQFIELTPMKLKYWNRFAWYTVNVYKMVKYHNKFHLEFDGGRRVFIVIRDKQISDDKLLRWGFEDYKVMLVSGLISSILEVLEAHFVQVVKYSFIDTSISMTLMEWSCKRMKMQQMNRS